MGAFDWRNDSANEHGLFSDAIWSAPVRIWMEIKDEAGEGELIERLVLTRCYQSNPCETVCKWADGLNEVFMTVIVHLIAQNLAFFEQQEAQPQAC